MTLSCDHTRQESTRNTNVDDIFGSVFRGRAYPTLENSTS